MVIMMVVEKCKKQPKQPWLSRMPAPATAEGAEVDNIIRCVREAGQIEGNYDLLHLAPGGVRMLIGASFTVLATPQERHVMAKYIYDKEVKIHGSRQRALRCLRTKGWSQKETYECLDHVEKPNYFKTKRHQVYISFIPLK